MLRQFLIGTLFVSSSYHLPCLASAETIALRATETLRALEMNHGDTLEFQRQNGQTWTLTLVATDAAILERVTPGGIVYQFRAHVRVDGQPMTLHRYVCSQECFHEPYVIDGVRIWLDTVKDVFDLIPIRYPRKGNQQCLPRKDARFALQDAALRICPDPLLPWIEDERSTLDVAECYNGDDCYLGPYLGQACHVGLDVNHAKGSTLTAPLNFDTHAYFNSLTMGHNNNRWRGIRRWPNGEVWALQTHHLIDLLVPPNTPLSAGTRYATTAGVRVGSHEHTHFEFKIGRPRKPDGTPTSSGREDAASSIAEPINFDDDSAEAQERPEVLHLDPWIVFWQIFEDRRDGTGGVQAVMQPVRPARTGQHVVFSAESSRAGGKDRTLLYRWTFGDGTSARGSMAKHAFARKGVYPVSLSVDDGQNRDVFVQHIVVNGPAVKTPVLALLADDEPSFRIRQSNALDIYVRPITGTSHTFSFVARPSRPRPLPRSIRLANLGGGTLSPANPPEITYQAGAGWLGVTSEGRGSGQRLRVSVNASGLSPGEYSADVRVACGIERDTSTAEEFHVRLHVLDNPPQSDVTIDNEDPGFYATPYFWIGHRFCRCPANRRGHRGFYVTNGGRPVTGEYARFRPDLEEGTYRVAFHKETPFRPDTEFDVRVRCRAGDQVVRVSPAKSRVIGEFEFHEGTDGFVEIRAGGSKGLVIADAVTFIKK